MRLRRSGEGGDRAARETQILGWILVAPAMLLASRARFVDLDGPLLLARDRDPGLVYDGSLVQPPSPALWG